MRSPFFFLFFSFFFVRGVFFRLNSIVWGGDYAMHNKRIARLARDAFLNKPLFDGFTDIRLNPSIRLQTILTSLFLMPFFGFCSLLSNDRCARTLRYKGLFGCRRKMVCSDSTFARVLKWLKLSQAQSFLLRFLSDFERHDLLRKQLSVGGKRYRLGILDGSYMGGHWLVSLCLTGVINYPLMVRRCSGQGEEQSVARSMMKAAKRLLGSLRPELWLLDALYFNRNTIKIARGQKSHLLFKFKEADFRTVTKDAQNLFEHFGADEQQSGWDNERSCRWTVRQTLDSFGAYPVQVVELTEFYPKRKQDRTVTCWIVTTDVDLPLGDLREAAHQRWQIENNVFKRISHLSGTKRFYFKDYRQFFNLLHLFFAAVAVLDCIIASLRAHRLLFDALRGGIKPTWLNVFSRVQEVLYGISFAFEHLT
jgi:hypothetical protein